MKSRPLYSNTAGIASTMQNLHYKYVSTAVSGYLSLKTLACVSDSIIGSHVTLFAHFISNPGYMKHITILKANELDLPINRQIKWLNSRI